MRSGLSPFEVLKESFGEWNRDNASRLAAALAYYTIFSIAPLLILVIAIAGLFFDATSVREQLMGQIQALVGTDGADFLRSVLDNANQPGEQSGWVASAISVGLLILGATGVLTQLQTALNVVWNVKAKPELGFWGVLRKRALSFGMLLGIGFVLLVSLMLSAIVAGFSSYLNNLAPGLDAAGQLLSFLVSFGVTTFVFALIYKFVPDVNISWGDVWFGGIVTALLFSLGKTLIGLYLGNNSFGSTYGAAGSVVILLVWVFYSAQILFFGAELTQVYARRYGSRITPNEYAVKEYSSSQKF
jgi:membrane protein